jgi:hypothetical protein
LSANFINAAKKSGSNAVSHCQFVPEIVQCAVNVFTYKSINQFDPSLAGAKHIAAIGRYYRPSAQANRLYRLLP